MDKTLPIAESAEFTCFLGSRGILSDAEMTVTDILLGLQFFYPFDIYLRKRDIEDDPTYNSMASSERFDEDISFGEGDSSSCSKNLHAIQKRRRIDIHDQNRFKAIVFDIKLEHAFHPDVGQGAIMWMFSYFDNHFYFDAKHLLHDMRVKCNLTTDDDEKFPYGILSELVYPIDNGFSTLHDLLVYQKKVSIYDFPWPLDISEIASLEMKREVNRFCSRDGQNESKEKKSITTENLTALHRNPYQTEFQFHPNYCYWRGLMEVKETKSARQFDWSHRGFIVSVQDKYGNKCSYIHPKLMMYFNTKVFAKDKLHCVNGLFTSYSKRAKKHQDEQEEMLRDELLDIVEYVKPPPGQTWIKLEDAVAILLNNPSRLQVGANFTTNSYDRELKKLASQLRVALINTPWKTMNKGIIKVDNLSISPLQYDKHAVLVWTESKREVYIRHVAHEKEL